MITATQIRDAKILIVDDQQANVDLLDRMLRGDGYTSVASTLNPGEVCELHRANRYDLILLDLQMPGMDGFQVMEGLKEIETDGYLPVLVITAQPEHKLRALKAGAKDFVAKPFDLAEVLTRVRNMLEVRLLHREARRLYDQLKEEQKMSERLLRHVMPRSVAERFKTDLSVSELLRLAEATTTGEGSDPKELRRRSADQIAGQMAMLVTLTLAVVVVAWLSLYMLPIWGRVMASLAIGAFVVALRFEWNRRFVQGEMQGEATAHRAHEAKGMRGASDEAATGAGNV